MTSRYGIYSLCSGIIILTNSKNRYGANIRANSGKFKSGYLIHIKNFSIIIIEKAGGCNASRNLLFSWIYLRYQAFFISPVNVNILFLDFLRLPIVKVIENADKLLLEQLSPCFILTDTAYSRYQLHIIAHIPRMIQDAFKIAVFQYQLCQRAVFYFKQGFVFFKLNIKTATKSTEISPFSSYPLRNTVKRKRTA